jgi:hypothetical protein
MPEQWPNTLPPPDKGTQEGFYKPQRKLEFEANYVQTAPRATRGRRRFELKWQILTESEYQTLEGFFDANQGTAFEYVHPLRGTTHMCVFSSDEIKHQWRSGDQVGVVECQIEEQ